jgi:hypothetical protein
MKVKELIDKLSLLSPDTEIHFDELEDNQVTELLDQFASEQEIELRESNAGWALLPLVLCILCLISFICTPLAILNLLGL